MLNRLLSLLCLSALGFGAVVLPANASETRVEDFSLQCDGTERTVVFTATGLGTAASRFIQGAEVSVTDSSLQSLLVRVAGDPTKVIRVTFTNTQEEQRLELLTADSGDPTRNGVEEGKETERISGNL